MRGNNRTDLFISMEESTGVVVLLSEGEKEDDSDIVISFNKRWCAK